MRGPAIARPSNPRITIKRVASPSTPPTWAIVDVLARRAPSPSANPPAGARKRPTSDTNGGEAVKG
jgi:hypothetical protein